MSEKQWARVGPSPRVGPIQFREDGGFQVAGTGTVFDRSNEMVNCRIGPGTRFDFRDGQARLENASEIHHLRFVGQEGWEHVMVRKGESSAVAAGRGKEESSAFGTGCPWWLFPLIGGMVGAIWGLFR